MNARLYTVPVSRRWVSVTLTVLMATLSLWAISSYPGSPAWFTIYCVVAIALVGRMLTRPAGFFALFFVAFLTLGCWAKLVFHFILANRMVEPIGAFNDSPAAWDQALMVLTVTFATLLVVVTLIGAWCSSDHPESSPIKNTPYLSLLLGLAIIWSIGLLAFNFHYNILKIGTVPALQLHSYVYVLIAFMVAWGNTILLATLGFWMVQERRLSPIMLFVLLNIEGCLAAISMGSRAQMILHAAVPFAVYFLLGARLNWALKRRDWLIIFPITLILFVASIVAVSADRLNSFATAIPVQKTIPAAPVSTVAGVVAPPKTGSHASPTLTLPTRSIITESEPKPVIVKPPAPILAPPPVSAELRIIQWKGVMYQLSRLVVDRWIGLEGVLAVTAQQQDLNQALLVQGLKEDPNLGTAALYQVMSGSKYEAFENFTFMTIPGPIAVLYYSGSLAVVALGIAALFLVGFAIEQIATTVLKNPLTSCSIGVAMAYLIVQTNFPKALWFFMLELVLFVVGLMVLKKLLEALRARTA